MATEQVTEQFMGPTMNAVARRQLQLDEGYRIFMAGNHSLEVLMEEDLESAFSDQEDDLPLPMAGPDAEQMLRDLRTTLHLPDGLFVVGLVDREGNKVHGIISISEDERLQMRAELKAQAG